MMDFEALPPELLGSVIALLPFPADRARFRAVCRAWHAAARQHVRQLPWIVLPDCSFCTIDGNGNQEGAHFQRIPGVPENATCLGAAADRWLALDCTDDALRRTCLWARIVLNLSAKATNWHGHSYLLHNPFSGETVALPELDSVFGHVPETFEIRKVLMRSPSDPDDAIAVLTNNNGKYNLVLCYHGKGSTLTPPCGLGISDVAFLGDRLYGIISEEELIAFDLGEDDDGMPTVGKCRRVIKRTRADGEDDPWSWLDEDQDGDSDQDEDDDDQDGDSDSDEDEDEEEDDDLLLINNMPGGEDTTTDYEAADNYGHIVTTRRLVTSHGNGGTDELLLVKHRMQVPPFTDHYTIQVEVFKADIIGGKWTDVGQQGGALFLSRCFSSSTPAYGDTIKQGFMYFVDANQVFDTNTWACRPFGLPARVKLEADVLLTWLLPPKLVV